MSQLSTFSVSGGVLPPQVPEQFTTDAGIAIPVANNLNVFGGTAGRDINTTGVGDTIHIDLNNAITLGDLVNVTGADALTLTTGDTTLSAGNINLASTDISGQIGIVNVNAHRFIHSYGTGNTFVGEDAGNLTLTVLNATFNTGIGEQTLISLTDGPANTALGAAALTACTTGSGNSAFGFQPLATLTTGINNTAVGGVCMNSLLSGSGNVGLGSALSALATGSDNIGIGNTAGQAYIGAESENIVIGSQGVVGDTKTIRIGTTGGGGVFQTSCYISGVDGVNVGSTAQVVTMGTAGTADQLGTAVITAGAGISVTPGANTITIAATGSAGISTINGNVGSITGATVTIDSTGNGTCTTQCSGTTMTIDFTDVGLNTAIGANSFAAVTSGTLNTFLGYQAGQSDQDGGSNVGIGYQALDTNVSGFGNVGVGTNSLANVNGGNFNTCIGYNSGVGLATTDSYNILIGITTGGSESATIRIGDGGNNTTFHAGGIGGVNVGSTANVVTSSTTSTNGTQLGTAVITAGAGITVTPGANIITIAAAGMGAFAWSVITANQTAAVENGYFCNKAGTLALALPAVSAVGDTIEVTNENTALGVQFTQAAGQQILIGNTNTTLGATGTLTSSAVGDTLTIVCKVANTIWRVTSMVGNWTPA